MYKCNIFINTFMVFTVLLSEISSRKYDLEAESLRLYGEDLQSVLRRFRRSTDYLQLLEEKNTELGIFFSEVTVHAMQYVTENQLKKRVADFCHVDDEPHIARYYRSRRDGDDPENHENGTLNPIALLDHYVQYRSILTARELNKIRDLAFEIAGQTIHMIVKGMGPLDTVGMSTRQPFGGDAGDIVPTTERDHRHVISTVGIYEHPEVSTTVGNEPQDTAVDQTLRGFNKFNKL